ncbi:uncharacterized protein LOC130629397 isoform X2 [Hydractinia symbiolongicarpus]|nr:uncharacterized protein LOC130628939 isoform X2 [Hydractinia symbiolongicarpus]XP_057298554.1 uncharacterized protein LOC130629397 isoform X2 [Hydractinia symbiolongicarpus]
MFETDVDGSETIKHIESDLYERFQVRLELIKYMKGQEGSESVVSGCYPLPERNKLDGQDECDADSQETKSSETDELSNDVPLRKKKKWSYMPTKQDELVEKLDGANKRLTRLENLTSTLSYRIHELKEKNASLLLRNAEFTRLKLVEQLGMNRSVQMVDASLFASRFHTGDPLLQEETPCILDSAFISTLKITDFCEGVFASTKRAMFDDGDTVILKTFSKDCRQNNIKNVAHVSHEHRILKFIGRHENLVSSIGVVHFDQSYYSVLHYVAGYTLDRHWKLGFPDISSTSVFKRILTGVASGISFLHSKGVLHNHIVADNVILHGQDLFPILIGFSFACRATCVRNSCVDVIKLFPDKAHLAPELFQGCPVSYSTDIFSYGKLLDNYLKNMSVMDDKARDKLESFSIQCMDWRAPHRLPHKFLFRRVGLLLTELGY